MALTNGQITQVMTQRMVLGIAIVLGFVPLMGTLAVGLGGNAGDEQAQGAMLSCGFTLLPASLLAFWFRRVAGCWFGLNAVVVLAAICFGHLMRWNSASNFLFYVAMPFFLPAFLAFAELFHWPAVLAPSNRPYAER